MRKNFARLLAFGLFTIFAMAASPLASGQSAVSVTPSILYRFEVSPFDGGHLLTGYPEEGAANNYTNDPIPNLNQGGSVGIYVPPSGYTPAPASGLVALHRWTVIQYGWRTHYYYSTYYSQQPSDRYYNGIAGYVFPPGTTQHQFTGTDGNGTVNFVATLNQLSVYYSQDLGFWNGYGSVGYGFFELPPNRPYRGPYQDQGIIAALPQAQQERPAPCFNCIAGHDYDVVFYPPGGGGGGGTPPPDCNPPSGIVSACERHGGFWDYETCSCQY